MIILYRNGESHGFGGLQVRETPLKDSMNHNASVIGTSQDWVMHVWKPIFRRAWGENFPGSTPCLTP